MRLATQEDGGNEDGGGVADLMRGSNGLCVPCKPVKSASCSASSIRATPSRNFAGYTDLNATRKKLVRSVLKKDDCWFRTGDLMRTDADGYVYFADRMGDTFRYKGENVSTAEVAAAIGSHPGLKLQHCLVYGVSVPHVDGKVGMAAVLPEGPSWIVSDNVAEHSKDGYVGPRRH